MKNYLLLYILCLPFINHAMEDTAQTIKEILQSPQLETHKLIPFLLKPEQEEILTAISNSPHIEHIPQIIKEKVTELYDNTLSSIEPEPIPVCEIPIEDHESFFIDPKRPIIITSDGVVYNIKNHSKIKLDRAKELTESFYFIKSGKLSNDTFLLTNTVYSPIFKKQAHIWRISTGELLSTIPSIGYSKPQLNSSGDLVAFENQDHHMTLWDLEQHKEKVTFPNSVPLEEYFNEGSILFSNNSKFILFKNKQKLQDQESLTLWDLEKQQAIAELPGESATFSNNNTILATLLNNKITLFDLKKLLISGQLLLQAWMNRIKFNSNDQRFACYKRNTGETFPHSIWDIANLQCIFQFPHESEQSAINASMTVTSCPNDKYGYGKNSSQIISHLSSKKTIKLPDARHFCVFDSASNYIITDASHYSSNQIEIRKLMTGMLITVLPHDNNGPYKTFKPTFSDDGIYLITTPTEKLLKVYRLDSIAWPKITDEEKKGLFILENAYLNKGSLPIEALNALSKLGHIANERYGQHASQECLYYPKGHIKESHSIKQGHIEHQFHYRTNNGLTVFVKRTLNGLNKNQVTGTSYDVNCNPYKDLSPKLARTLYHLAQKQLRSKDKENIIE